MLITRKIVNKLAEISIFFTFFFGSVKKMS